MTLDLIAGPPNSGRAGLVRSRFAAALEREPLLVVPTGDDVAAFERELCEDGGAVVGGAVVTFARLFAEVTRATGATGPPVLTPVQRLAGVRAAVSEASLGPLAGTSKRAGFAPAVDGFLAEVQAAAIEPAAFVKRASTIRDGGIAADLGSIYVKYASVRDRLGRGDQHTLAAAATSSLRAQPDAWGARPVLLYGFDDLTPEQLALTSALAASAEVTVSLTYEQRAALEARERLLGQLQAIGGTIVAETSPDPANTESAALFGLERRFLDPGAEPIALDEGLVMLEAGGERGEAEHVCAEVARLIGEGEDPNGIAIVVRSPNAQGPLYAGILESYGIPAAVDARVPFAATATGRGLLAALRAGLTTRTAKDVIDMLRAPGRSSPGKVDRLERSVRQLGLRSADEALEQWGDSRWEIDVLRAAPDGRELFSATARIARSMSERPHDRQGALLHGADELEVRAAQQAATALAELSELPALAGGAEEAIAALSALQVSLAPASAHGGRVQLISPYRARARRFSHVFLASLQDGEFPRRDSESPFVPDEARERMGLPPRAPTDAEERYLFHVCLSRPVRRLYLSWRACDDEGRPAARSPFVDDLCELIEPPSPPDPDHAGEAIAAATRERPLAAVTFEAAAAPSDRELARALALRGPDAWREALGPMDLDSGLEERLRAQLERAAEAGGLPGPLRVPEVVEELASRRRFGASSLESYSECSYRWFVDRELVPNTLDPEDDARKQGQVVHSVLEGVYREAPGGGPGPRPDTLSDWIGRARDVLTEQVEGTALAPVDARSRAVHRKLESNIVRFIARDARRETPLAPRADLLEARFGAWEGAAKPPLDLDTFELHGTIDRVDVPRNGNGLGRTGREAEDSAACEGPAACTPATELGLIRDYKSSRSVPAAEKLREKGKLQLQLYALALERLWGIRPLGAVYEPLGAAKEDDSRPRGILRKEEQGLLSGGGCYKTDFFDEERFEEALTDARDEATRIVESIRAGTIRRDPIDGVCPRYCTYQPVCRRERGVIRPPDDEDEEEEELL